MINEEWDVCGNISMMCQENCAVVRGEQPLVLCKVICSPGCKCKEGYVRASETNTSCVLRENCGRFENFFLIEKIGLTMSQAFSNRLSPKMPS